MEKPLISIVMGSDSDLSVMKEASDILNQFNVPHETLILSAHRSPEETARYAKQARNNGIRVIIAGAGGAAHLAGVIASLTTLPVIGIPIKTPALNGTDSLFSIVQMPPGIPVATVGINAAKNAGILATQILALSDSALQKKLEDYKKSLSKSVLEKTEKLKKIGIEKYLSNS